MSTSGLLVFSLADSGMVDIGMVDMGLCEVISTSESTASVAESKCGCFFMAS